MAFLCGFMGILIPSYLLDYDFQYSFNYVCFRLINATGPNRESYNDGGGCSVQSGNSFISSILTFH